MASTVADRLRHCRSPDHLHAPPRRTLAMRLGRQQPRYVLRFHGCSSPTPATTPGSPCSRRIWSGFSRSTVWWWCCCSTTHRSTSRLSDVYDQNFEDQLAHWTHPLYIVLNSKFRNLVRTASYETTQETLTPPASCSSSSDRLHGREGHPRAPEELLPIAQDKKPRAPKEPRRKPDGVSREVYALTGGVGMVLLMPTIEASHLKCRPAVEKVKLMALLLLRHTLTITSSDDEDDASAIFSLFLLRAAGFLLPCYIMAWAISIMVKDKDSWKLFAAEMCL
ncbi:uncharacterized protein LOC124646890 [Lolium rigidum]|uniref:uncharacterized protein LOC124646890 n=1 Tax=Lolium rigidum TaxID=89674 RepID=UPI001F5D71F2|nr:uncharacterized protein LOC124646890 [Lolium rigidum]